MWHMGRNDKNFRSAYDDLRALNLELQRTFEHVGNLFVIVAVKGNHTTGAQDDSCQHAALPVDELPIEQRIDLFGGRVVETDVLKRRGVLRCFIGVHVSAPFSARRTMWKVGLDARRV